MVNETSQVLEEIKVMSKEGVIDLKNGIVDAINEIISGIAPNVQVQFVFVIVVIIGIIIKRWQKWNWSAAIVAIFAIFFFI